MKKLSVAIGVSLAFASGTMLAPLAVQAQNVAVVNGKSIPKARVDALISQVSKQAEAQGQQMPPDLEKRARDKVVQDEIFVQEAEKRGLGGSADYKQQMELARQAILIQTLFSDYQKKNPVTEDDVKAEYEKFKAQSAGTEYKTRHILVEKEEDAKSLIAQLKSGAKFEELAKKNSKDPGSAEKGGDLDWANPGSYVPEFSQAMAKLGKGQMTEAPVKSQFGWHIIKVEDTREAKFPPIEEVKPQIQQRLGQMKLAQFRDELRAKAKTDYKFSN